MIQVSEQLARPVEIERSNHPLCALTSALSLIAGKQIRIPKRAYPWTSPSKLARLLQVGNGAWELLLSAGRPRALVSGKKLAYRDGEVEYFTGHIFRRWRSFPSVKRPFFVVSGGDPAGSIAAVTGCDPQPAPRLFIASIHCTVVIMANWGGIPAVIHYAACDEAIPEVERQANGLRIAASDPQIGHLLARLLAHTNLSNGAAVLAQTRIPSDPYQFSWRRIDAATELWLGRKPTSEDGGIVRLGPRLAQVCAFFPRFRDLLVPAADALMEWSETVRIPGCVTHGDFWLSNVLFRGDTIAGIIDWEWARRDGIPLVDVMYMLLFTSACEHDVTFTQYLRQLWADEIDEAPLTSRIATMGTQSGMDKDDLKFIALALWFDFLCQRAIRGSVYSARWVEDMIPQTVPEIMKWLNRHSKTAGMRAVTH
jgi:hypothetical protein